MELSEQQHAQVSALLQQYVSSVDGVRSAVLASVDGFALAEVSGSDKRGQRLAAMTSAMLALAGAVGRELELGDWKVLMLEALNGKVLMLSLNAGEASLLLMAACDQRSVIGNVLWSSRECGKKLLEVLARD